MSNASYRLLFLIALVLGSCKAPEYSGEELPDAQLSFGSGGGFTGAKKEYILLENGQLFYKNSLVDTLQEMPAIKSGQARKIFRELSALTLDTVKFNHPGNTYRYICHRRPGTEDRVTWGDLQHQVSPEIAAFYKKLDLLVRDQ